MRSPTLVLALALFAPACTQPAIDDDGGGADDGGGGEDGGGGVAACSGETARVQLTLDLSARLARNDDARDAGGTERDDAVADGTPSC